MPKTYKTNTRNDVQNVQRNFQCVHFVKYTYTMRPPPSSIHPPLKEGVGFLAKTSYTHCVCYTDGNEKDKIYSK